MEFANTDSFARSQRPLQKRLTKDRRSNLQVSGRVATMTVRNYLVKHWLPLAEMGIEPITASSYRSMIRLYVLPYIADVRVGQLDRATIQNFYSQLLRQRNSRTGRPLGEGTVIRVHCLLHSALEDLVVAGRLPSNPARGARPRHVKSERYEYRIWTQRQVQEFMEIASSDRLFALWRLLAFTGMRRGEALGLQRSDLRLATRQLAVRRALAISERELYVTRPKTDAERVIELDNETVRVLRSHLRRQRRTTTSNEWLFTNVHGELLHPAHVSQMFRKLADSTNLPRIRLHDLRHTHASHLILAGANVKAVQERLGHSDVVVTLNIYSHVLPTTQRYAVRQLERFYAHA